MQALARRLGKQTVAPADTAEAASEPSDQEIETVIDHHREQAYDALQAFLPSLLANRPLELRVVFGRPFERIVETAVKEEVGLIVMGTHGRTGLSRLALGSGGRTGGPPSSVFGLDREGTDLRIGELAEGVLRKLPRCWF